MAGKFVSCECCVLSGRGLCVGLIIRAEESCRSFVQRSPAEYVCVCVCVCTSKCDCQTSTMRTPWPKGDVAPFGEIANGDSFRNLLELNQRKVNVYFSAALTRRCQDHREVSDA